MKILLSPSNDVYYNLSLEEAILKYDNLDEDILFIYQNSNTIVIGRNQNIFAEINREYVIEHDINLCRRISGGGAVYQDMGNVCFSFITKKSKKNGYNKFLTPIISFLNSLGLEAMFHGRNDLLVNAFKISGNAQYIYNDRIMHHGTLLFDANLAMLGNALKPNLLKLKSKAIKSIRQRVSNIKPLLNYELSTKEFISKLMQYFSKNNQQLKISNVISNEGNKLYHRYKTYEWIFGKSPKFDNKIEYYFTGGLVEIQLTVEKALIKDIIIYGDFLSKRDISVIIEKLKNIPYTKHSIEKVLSCFNLKEYFGTINKKEILDIILGNIGEKNASKNKN